MSDSIQGMGLTDFLGLVLGVLVAVIILAVVAVLVLTR